MRKQLLMYRGPDNTKPFALSLTVPGDVVTPEQFRRVWDVWRKRVDRLGGCGYWRVELQKRRQPHIHALIWLDSVLDYHLITAWWKAVKSLGPYEKQRGKVTITFSSRMALKGAECHSAAIERAPEDDHSWWRYMLAHATKSKQDQLGWQGRQWGVIASRRLIPDRQERDSLTRAQWYWVRRRLRRLTRYAGAGRGRSSVWYVRPDTMRALVYMARNTYPTTSDPEYIQKTEKEILELAEKAQGGYLVE